MHGCAQHCPSGHGAASMVVAVVKVGAAVAVAAWLVVGPLAGVLAAVLVLGVVGYVAREVVGRRLDDRREATIRERWAAEAAQREEQAEEESEPQALPAGQRQLEAPPIRVAAFRVDERARGVA